MGQKSEEIFDCDLINPERFYKTPEAVLADDRLSQTQKEKILRCWEQDELALIRAEEENMTPKTDKPMPVEVFEKIKAAEKTLESDVEQGKPA